MDGIKLEICCGSVDDVFAAKAAGADRVELNAALFLGGLTPGLGQVLAAREAGIPIMAMVRPREGGFCYTDREFAGMVRDVEALAAAGVEGLVFGVLQPDGSLDAERCRTLIQAAGNRETVLHRCMDVTPDWREALDTAAELGFTRVLTSGQAPSALFGAPVLREMVERAGDRIEILPGGGIRPNNVARVVEATGCRQVHASAGRKVTDPSCLGNPDIHFGSPLYLPEDQYSTTDENRVRGLLEGLGR